MINRDDGLSLGRQAKVPGINRSNICYLPRPASDANPGGGVTKAEIH